MNILTYEKKYLISNGYAGWRALGILLFIVSATFFSSTPVQAGPTAFFNGNPMGLQPFFQFVYEDQNSTIESISIIPYENWVSRAELESLPHGTHATIWMKTRITTDQSLDDIVIRFNYPHYDYIDFYVFADGKLQDSFHAGDRVKAAGVVDDVRRTFWFPLALPKDSEREVYVRIETTGPMLLPVDILSIEDAYKDEMFFRLWSGILIGVLLFMMLYNAFLFITLWESAYLLFVLYLASSAVLVFLVFGYGQEFFWFDQPDMNNSVLAFISPLNLLIAVCFVLNFLDYKKYPTATRYFGYLMVCVGATLTLASFTVSYSIIISATYITAFVGLFAGLFMGLKGWFAGIQSARIFTLAWVAHIAFVIWFLLDIGGYIESTYVGGQAFIIGSIVELIILSLAFANKMNEEKELRISSQTKLLDLQLAMNTDLDEKVRERTVALQVANQKLQELSTTDGLTKLFNRRHFDQLYRQHYQQSVKNEHPISVIMIDVDFFKKLNDNYGHAFGDLCLIEVSALIKQFITMPDAFAARYGGEEFVVVLPKTSESNACQFAEALRKAVKGTMISNDDQTTSMTVSIGVAGAIPKEDMDLESLLRIADQCLYHSKEHGRDQVTASSSLASNL
ncbi:MAG: sensor domain-containing diguanylate cyclase [Oleibacter sp.]|nr:sensor domain-containing diguanylate cyclase [Thalassolituus sp.]